MLAGDAGRRTECRLQLGSLALVGQRDDAGLLRKIGASQLFFGSGFVQCLSGRLPSRQLLYPVGQRRSISRFDVGMSEQFLHFGDDISDLLLQ